MNVFGKFDEIQTMILQDIKETKRYRLSFVRTDGQTDNVKTVYPPTNTVCGGYNNQSNNHDKQSMSFQAIMDQEQSSYNGNVETIETCLPIRLEM